MLLDIDASLVDIRSEHKVDTAPTYKGGFGFHPMFCFASATHGALWSVAGGQRRGRTVGDHVSVLDASIGQLVGEITAAHHEGDDPALVGRHVIVRADSAGCTEGFLRTARRRNIGFFVTVRSNTQVTVAILRPYAFEWGERVLILGGDGRLGQVTPPA